MITTMLQDLCGSITSNKIKYNKKKMKANLVGTKEMFHHKEKNKIKTERK